MYIDVLPDTTILLTIIRILPMIAFVENYTESSLHNNTELTCSNLSEKLVQYLVDCASLNHCQPLVIRLPCGADSATAVSVAGADDVVDGGVAAAGG